MVTGWSPTSMPRLEAQFTPLYPDLSGRSVRELEAAEEYAAREEA